MVKQRRELDKTRRDKRRVGVILARARTLYSGWMAVSVVEVDVESLESCSISSSRGPSGKLATCKHDDNPDRDS